VKPTSERLRELFSYDPDTGVFVRLVRTNPRVHVGDVAGCISSAGYLRIRVDIGQYYAHRLAFLYMTGSWPTFDIDHKNGNGLDNRWDNLRSATRSQNMANTKLPLTNTSGYKGVRWDKARGKWRAEIRIKGRSRHLGLFATAEEAHAAYMEKAREVFGEFARAA